MIITAAEAIIKVIEEQGIKVVYGYPGAANTPIYDSVSKTDLRYILTRNEQGAAHAASSYYKMTGKVGVCIATSGPGATNLVTGIANANMDSTPMVVITGQVPSHQVGKDVFQEVDVFGVTTPITKHNYLIKKAEDVVRVMREAFYIAGTGRKGPVLVDVPMDIQMEQVEFTPPQKPQIRGYNPEREIDEKQIKKLSKALKVAKRPFIVLGGGVLGSGASEAFLALVEKLSVPVASTLMGITAMPSKHPQYLGMLGIHGTKAANQAFLRADLVVFMGARVSDRAVNDAKSLSERAKIVHIDIDPAEINKNIQTDISIVADIKDVIVRLLEEVDFKCAGEWLDTCLALKEQNIKAGNSEGAPVNPKLFLKKLSEAASEETIVATEVGQHQIWTANHYAFSKPDTFLTSGGFGTMGYGLPAAIGAKIARPKATVIAIEGDGSFQMSMPELGAMKQWGADVKIVVFVNRSLGMVREYQKRYYKENYVSVDLGEYPHFDKIAEAYDIPHYAIASNEEIDEGIKRLLSDDGAFLLEVAVSQGESTL